MQDTVNLTGMILKTEPIGEYDRRIVLLSLERGKVIAFAKGARRPGNRFMASTNLFSFGQFKLYEGRNSYSLVEVSVQNYFENLRTDYEGACYGMYFLEVADYFTRENNDEVSMLKLLYQSLRALEHERLNNRLVRCIFEIKSIVVNGEYPGVPDCKEWQKDTLYALDFIVRSSIEKLYTFVVSDRVLNELTVISDIYQKRFIDRKFKSIEILETLC